MRVVIVTGTPEVWGEFQKAWEGAALECVADVTEATQLARTQKLDLVIWDHATDPEALRNDVIAIMMVDAKIHQTMVTEMSEEDFHEATEGLGLLPPVAPARDAVAVTALLASIKAASF